MSASFAYLMAPKEDVELNFVRVSLLKNYLPFEVEFIELNAI